MNTYPGDDWTNVWSDAKGANLANLLWSNSDKIGCLRAVCAEDNTETTKAVLFCKLTTVPQENKAAFA